MNHSITLVLIVGAVVFLLEKINCEVTTVEINTTQNSSPRIVVNNTKNSTLNPSTINGSTTKTYSTTTPATYTKSVPGDRTTLTTGQTTYVTSTEKNCENNTTDIDCRRTDADRLAEKDCQSNGTWNASLQHCDMTKKAKFSMMQAAIILISVSAVFLLFLVCSVWIKWRDYRKRIAANNGGDNEPVVVSNDNIAEFYTLEESRSRPQYATIRRMGQNIPFSHRSHINAAYDQMEEP